MVIQPGVVRAGALVAGLVCGVGLLVLPYVEFGAEHDKAWPIGGRLVGLSAGGGASGAHRLVNHIATIWVYPGAVVVAGVLVLLSLLAYVRKISPTLSAVAGCVALTVSSLYLAANKTELSS